MPSLHTATEEMMAELGVTEPMPSAFPRRFDPREDLRDAIDLDWIGEDAAGIWTRRHIDAALAEDAELHDVTTRWGCTTDKALRAEDIDRLSNWETVAWLTMLAAQNREEMRRMKAGGGEHGA